MNYILKYKKIFIFTLFLIIGLVVYGNTFNNEFFWDDDDSVVNNHYIRDWDNLDKFFTENLIAGAGQISNYYRPVLLISFALDYHFWELEPFGYHLTNTLLHIFNAFLIFLILYKLINISRKKILSVQGGIKCLALAFLVSLFFLVHPLQTEAVTYVAGRADPLSSLFSLLVIFFYIKFRYLLSQKIYPVSLLHGVNLNNWSWRRIFCFKHYTARRPGPACADRSSPVTSTNLPCSAIRRSGDSPRKFIARGLAQTVGAVPSLVSGRTRQISVRQVTQFVGQNINTSLLYYFLIILFFILGLLTKEQVILLPALLLLIELVFYIKKFNKKNIIKTIKLLLPLFLISGIYFLIRIYLLNFNDLLSGADLINNYDSGIVSRIVTFGWVIILYFKLLFIPLGLHMAREVDVVTFMQFAVFLISLFVILISCIKTWKRDKLITFGFLWFFIILLPRMNLIPINRPMYEHWLYLPMIGFWLAIFSLLILFFKWVKREHVKWAIYLVYLYFILYILLFLFFCILTIMRNNDWQNPIIFYEKNLKFTPNSYIQHNNLGMAYSDKDRIEDAIKEYKIALSIADKYPQVHSNLAHSLRDLGRLDEAIVEYKIAIEMSPTFSIPYYGLLNIYLDRKDKENILELLEIMEILFKNDMVFNYNSGIAYYSIGNYNEAILHWRRILNNNPNERSVRELIKDARLKNK